MSAKLAKYDRLYEQIKGYVQTTDDIWARLATMEAVLHHKMQTFFWTGVYALIDDELIVRSYQGPVACQKLRHHTGVCWAAVSTGETVIVPDVERFPGHIACNSKSRSEIVLPIRDREGRGSLFSLGVPYARSICAVGNRFLMVEKRTGERVQKIMCV